VGRPRRRKRGRNSRSTSVRVTRTKGSGSNKTTSYRTGGVSITGMSPTGRIAGKRPTIRATVRDAGGGLSKNGIRFYLNGSEKTRFHFDPASGRLTYYVGNALPPGTHRVEIEAESDSGDDKGSTSGTARKRWTFTVAR
jgi:hypothetical protein